MTLPFQADDKRIFVCFCCGIPHDKWEEYVSHIVESHEEGREFVYCPLARCRAPVRDVRTHFKAKHPRDKIPNNCQMRAIIWTDQRNPRNKKKPKFKEGWIESAKNGKKMHYRSNWEKEVYGYLENNDQVLGYQVESFKVEYYFNGKSKNYLPDLLIHFVDGHYEVWEIKPSNQMTLAVNKAKWSSCQLYCETRGWLFDVKTEHDIKKMRKNV